MNTTTTTYTNRQVRGRAKRFVAARNNRPIERSAISRLLRALPEGPFTTTELRTEVAVLDLSELAQSTQDAYRGVLRSFVRFIEEGE